MLSTGPTAIEDKILHLKDFPGDLHSQLKSKAALEGIPMRDFVIDALRRAVMPDKKSESRRAS